MFCSEEIGVVTGSLKGPPHGESFDWKELLVIGTSEDLATFTNKLSCSDLGQICC